MTIKTLPDYSKMASVFLDKLNPNYQKSGHENNSVLAAREEGVLAAEEQSMHEMRFLQMLVTAVKLAQEPTAPITINNISASHSESVSKTEGSGVAQIQSRSSLELISGMYHAFFSSRFNRVCFFGMCGMGMYVYWSYLDHKWHMIEVQRRIDSNLVLKMSQWLFSNDHPQPSRWLPFTW